MTWKAMREATRDVTPLPPPMRTKGGEDDHANSDSVPDRGSTGDPGSRELGARSLRENSGGDSPESSPELLLALEVERLLGNQELVYKPRPGDPPTSA